MRGAVARMAVELVSEVSDRRPARGYSWSPAEPGNELALKSGAWSPVHVDPLAQQIIEEIAGDPSTSYLAGAAYHPLLRSSAFAQSRLVLFVLWLAGMSAEQAATPPEGTNRNARAPIDLYRSLLVAASNLADKLGLSPLSRARLGRDVAVGQSIADQAISRLAAAGREALEGRES